MATSVVPFLFEKSQIRVIMIDGNPWFVAADICSALDISNTARALDRLDDDEKGIHTMNTPGGNQELSIINESGLYSLIMTSRKPEAKKFKKWVTSEVIPSIRKTGSYSASPYTALSSHTVRSVQIGNSKAVNHVQVAFGGVSAVINYNIKNCTIQSGRFPAEWKADAKREGFPAKHRNSAKDVLRVKAPHIACGMSLADQLVSGGANPDEGISIGKDSQHIFQRILSLGITPPELLL